MDKKIAKALADANVVKFGEFTLVSGMKTPVYFDLRILPSYPNSMKIVAEELSKLVKKLKADIVAGAETAGIPLSTAVSLKTKIPMIYARKMPKSYGTGEMIEGVLQKDAKVVLIDDMTTNGFSKIKFIDGNSAHCCDVLRRLWRCERRSDDQRKHDRRRNRHDRHDGLRRQRGWFACFCLRRRW